MSKDIDWTAKIPSHVPCSARTHMSSADMKKYVIFSEHTKGTTGKVVRIKAELFTRFASIVDAATHNGQMTIRQIEALRHASGAAQGSVTNINSAFRYMHKVKDMHVYYSVLNESGGSNKTAVFITDVKPDFGETNSEAGLYSYKSVTRKFGREKSSADLTEKSIFISGSQQNLQSSLDAATQRGVKADAIFYSPSDVSNDLGAWRTIGQSQRTQAAISELAKVFQNNAKKRVYWAAEGEGAGLVEQAMDEVLGKLEAHRMRLIDPVADTPSLLQKLKAKEVKIGGGGEDVAPITYTGERRAAQITLTSHARQLLQELAQLRVTPLNRDAHAQMVQQLQQSEPARGLSQAKNTLQRDASKDHRPSNVSKVAPQLAVSTFVAAIKQL